MRIDLKALSLLPAQHVLASPAEKQRSKWQASAGKFSVAPLAWPFLLDRESISLCGGWCFWWEQHLVSGVYVSSSLHLPGDFLLFAERLLVMIWEGICGDLENKRQKE